MSITRGGMDEDGTVWAQSFVDGVAQPRRVLRQLDETRCGECHHPRFLHEGGGFFADLPGRESFGAPCGWQDPAKGKDWPSMFSDCGCRGFVGLKPLLRYVKNDTGPEIFQQEDHPSPGFDFEPFRSGPRHGRRFR